MKIKTKIFSVVLALITIMSIFSGCSTFINSDKIAKQNCEEILQYLGNSDVESLKSMFCNKTKSLKNLDEQIQIAVDFFQGKMVSYEALTSSGGRATDNGKISSLDICPHITDIKTDSGNTYDIRFYSYIVCTADRDKEGISEITITSDNGEKCVIGDFYLVNPEYK